MPGKKQFFYALSCSLCFFSCAVKDTLQWGQISIVLTVCFYCMFWGAGSFWLRTLLFALIALLKYSVLPVAALLLFFKGYWKQCVAAFAVFVFFSITPAFCGNDLVDVFTEYVKAVHTIFQPGHLNHYDTHSETMCHLGFFKIAFLNYALKGLAACIVLWLFWRERNIAFFSDTLLLSAFCLTLLIFYHRCYDLVLVYPLILIRLYDFYKKRQWRFFGITLLFPLFLCIPRSLLHHLIPAWIGSIPKVGTIVYLSEASQSKHLFPILPFFMIALTLWSLYLYLHVKDPFRFTIPGSRKSDEEK